MQRLVIALTILAAAGPALAIGRYNSTGMTCEAARATLRSEGAAIFRYPSTRPTGMTLYDRYVDDSARCSSDEYAERAYIPTRDNPRCPVLSCEPIYNLEGNFPLIVPRNRL